MDKKPSAIKTLGKMNASFGDLQNAIEDLPDKFAESIWTPCHMLLTE
jgi:hypothetical protein